jgi:hypothetical protein
MAVISLGFALYLQAEKQNINSRNVSVCLIAEQGSQEKVKLQDVMWMQFSEGSGLS